MSQFGDNWRGKITRAFHEESMDEILSFERKMLTEMFEDQMSVIDSPIEALLLAAMLEDYTLRRILNWVEPDDHVSITCAAPGIGRAAAQYQIDRYRVDFAIYVVQSYGSITRLAIECDGHEFHEKTKEQAQRDKKRDRDLSIMGWKVIRFTGSEIFKDPQKCANEIGWHLDIEVVDDAQRGR